MKKEKAKKVGMKQGCKESCKEGIEGNKVRERMNGRKLAGKIQN